MSIFTLKDDWKTSFEEAIQSIENSLKVQPHDCSQTSEFRTFANWLMTTSHSSYDFLPNHWVSYKSNPYESDLLLSHIHHALLDDGEISFVTMKLEDKILRVFIVFDCAYEDYFQKICYEENQSMINSFINGRESMNRVLSSLKEQYPEKNVTLKPVIYKEDFSFTFHRKPLQFIEELNDFMLQSEDVILNQRLEALKKSK